MVDEQLDAGSATVIVASEESVAWLWLDAYDNDPVPRPASRCVAPGPG